MNTQKNEDLKMIAMILLICLAISIMLQIITILQVKFQIVGDFFPQSIIWEITMKNIIVVIVSTIVSIAGWVFYFNKKYILVMALAFMTIIWQQIYLSLN